MKIDVYIGTAKPSISIIYEEIKLMYLYLIRVGINYCLSFHPASPYDSLLVSGYQRKVMKCLNNSVKFFILGDGKVFVWYRNCYSSVVR